MNIQDDPKCVIILGDHNNVGDHNNKSNPTVRCSTCTNCAKLKLLKKRLQKLQEDIRIKDILIEYLTND